MPIDLAVSEFVLHNDLLIDIYFFHSLGKFICYKAKKAKMQYTNKWSYTKDFKQDRFSNLVNETHVGYEKHLSGQKKRVWGPQVGGMPF